MAAVSVDSIPSLPPIHLDQHVFSVCFHPTRQLIAASLITGRIHLCENLICSFPFRFDYSQAMEHGHTHVNQFTYHNKSVRSVLFNQTGTSLCLDGGVLL